MMIISPPHFRLHRRPAGGLCGFCLDCFLHWENAAGAGSLQILRLGERLWRDEAADCH